MDWQEIVRESFYDVTYRARVVDADGNEILNGATIPAGSQITIEKSPHESSDLYWHGMGGNLDTPYGHWLVGAAAPPMEFSPQDLFIDDHGRTGYDIYIPFSVNPPATSIQVSGTAGYSCNADNSACTVESEGTFLPEVVFDQTIGKSYLRVDYEQETGLRYCSNANNTDNALIIGETRLSSSPTEFMINVPQQSISFNFSVIEQSTPPTDPIIDPYEETNTGVPNESQAFSVVSTDPDGDSLYYQIDWDGDEIGDQRVPGFDYVASGISQDIAKTWIAEGTYTFKARAIDETGAQSGWTDHIVTITDPATPQLVVCPDNPTLSAIGSTQQMIAYYHAGTTETLDCTSQPAGTQDVTTSSTWSSDNSGVASVSPSGGLVTANSASGDGKADIEALYSGLNDATTATVLGLVNCYTCDTTSGSCSGSLQASCDASAGEYSDQSSCEADCSTSGGSSGGTNWREVAP